MSSPEEQKRQLREIGFTDINTYSRAGVKTDNEELLNQGGWIYYCSKTGKP